jgi:hypothetical protein
MPTPDRITPKPTPKPAPVSPVPPPMVPAPEQTSTISSVKPPPPPPIRCIPNGDDEVNIEIYSDDWNDDRFDRCERWENKHDMTIREYWNLYGIDSTVENTPLSAAEEEASPHSYLEDLGNSIIDNEDEQNNVNEEDDPPSPLEDLDDSILDNKDEYDTMFDEFVFDDVPEGND